MLIKRRDIYGEYYYKLLLRYGLVFIQLFTWLGRRGPHDGKLSAGDANFSQFKLIVTNADGTQTLQTQTLAQAGIANSLAHLKRHKESSRSQNNQIGVSN
ncbi:Hypothetical protein BN69_1085 [Methylocystis sp. SC2]|nr:Hypothetical protein BN69_1085 [Methylocystis sp. SC2]